MEFPVYEAPAADGLYQVCPTASIQEVEDQLDDWLDHRKGKKKVPVTPGPKMLVRDSWSNRSVNNAEGGRGGSKWIVGDSIPSPQ